MIDVGRGVKQERRLNKKQIFGSSTNSTRRKKNDNAIPVQKDKAVTAPRVEWVNVTNSSS